MAPALPFASAGWVPPVAAGAEAAPVVSACSAGCSAALTPAVSSRLAWGVGATAANSEPGLMMGRYATCSGRAVARWSAMLGPASLVLSTGAPAESVPVMSNPDEVVSTEGSDVVHDASRTATSAAKTARPSPHALRGLSDFKLSPFSISGPLRLDTTVLDWT